MKITKLGHCCLLIKDKGFTIITDPGSFSTGQDEVTGIDVVLITHEHTDHCHIESLTKVKKNNPSAEIFCNESVGRLLDEADLNYNLLSHGMKKVIGPLLLEAIGTEHAPIQESIPRIENTGFFIDERLFYPGDALTEPGREIEILALPIAGPWIKSSEAITYAKAINPKIVFPVHDGMLNKYGTAFSAVPEMVLKETGIDFRPLKAGQEIEC